MPGVKISNLQDGAALQNTDSFPVARGGATRRIEGSRLLTPETFQIQSTPTIGLNWNSNTKTLQASATSAVTSFNTVNSPTINLNWNSSTRTLSADVKHSSIISVVDSPTIDLSYNSSTGVLSAVTTPTVATSSSPMVAKAWVNFDGTTTPVTIRSSYGIIPGGVTRTATGRYTITLSTPLTNPNCVAVIGDQQLQQNLIPSTTEVYVFHGSGSPFVYSNTSAGIVVIFGI